jgi:hydrogenase 3 maturation protease
MEKMKISNSSWKRQLGLTLKKISAERQLKALRLVVLGIGNELDGDDAAGVLVVRSLQVISAGLDNLLPVEGGIAPENFTGKIRRFEPDVVLMVDAADFGAAPGSVRQLDLEEMDGFSASTHTLPPSVLANFLTVEMGCAVLFLGIQAGTLEFDRPVTPLVGKGVEEIAVEINRLAQEIKGGTAL